MSNLDVVRAWKDEEYRSSLSPTELALLPQNPAGLVELTDADLTGVDGAWTTILCITCVGTVVTVIVSVAATCTSCAGACC